MIKRKQLKDLDWLLAFDRVKVRVSYAARSQLVYSLSRNLNDFMPAKLRDALRGYYR